MSSPVKLVTKDDDAKAGVIAMLERALAKQGEHEFTAAAVVMIRNDGISFITTSASGNRCLLLGAVADLGYTIAKDGDG